MSGGCEYKNGDVNLCFYEDIQINEKSNICVLDLSLERTRGVGGVVVIRLYFGYEVREIVKREGKVGCLQVCHEGKPAS